MAEGDKVKVDVYNAIQSKIAAILGTGVNDRGYGQTVTSSQITAPGTSTKISNSQWANLRTDLLTVYNHQNSTNGALSATSTATKVSAAIASAYNTMADTCDTNRFLLDSGYSTLSTSISATQPGNTWGQSGSNMCVAELVFSFLQMPQNVPSYNLARYFFNAGGQIRISTSLSGTWGTTTKDYSWQSTFNKMGTVILAGAATTNTGSVVSGGPGFYSLNSSNQLIFSMDSTTYTPNTVKVYARFVSNYQLVITVYYEDLSISGNQTNWGPGYGIYGVDEQVQGNLTTSYQMKTASGGTPNAVTVDFPATTSITMYTGNAVG